MEHIWASVIIDGKPALKCGECGHIWKRDTDVAAFAKKWYDTVSASGRILQIEE